jgi:hypothetical protein
MDGRQREGENQQLRMCGWRVSSHSTSGLVLSLLFVVFCGGT